MEGIRATRRAVSHGALNNAYNSQARPIPHSLSRHGSRVHLRGANEYPALLPLPGPLESMLKTTTETGDIGAFSIRPSATFHQLPRQRSAVWDDGLRPSPRRQTDSVERSGGRFCREDDRRRLPSYRDPSTSDIISMYGSGSRRSGSSFRPVILDEMGPRSYSMTSSYGARHYHQSHSHSSAYAHGSSPSYLQRPRSPFPYPTRLKRPGVRPSSPALTENGIVDYTRMIGIDHVSYRTDYHRSYRQPPIYRQSSRRRPPLSLRSDVNRPMRSHPSQSSYRSQRTSSSGTGLHDQYPYGRPGHTWGHQPSETSDYDSTDINARNSSFGSIIDKYRYSSPIDTGSQNLHVPSGPFYYDYSEDFDYPRHEGNHRSRSPLVPLSAQTINSQRGFVRRDNCASNSRRPFSPSLSDSPTPNADEETCNNWSLCTNVLSEPTIAIPPSTSLRTQDLAAKSQIDPVSVIELLAPQAAPAKAQISPVGSLEAAIFSTPTQPAKRETWCAQGTFPNGSEQGGNKTDKRSSTSCVESVSSAQHAELTGTTRRPLSTVVSTVVSTPDDLSLVGSGAASHEQTTASSPHDNQTDKSLFTNGLQSSGFNFTSAPTDTFDKPAENQSHPCLDEFSEGQVTTKQSRLWYSPSSNNLIEKSQSIRPVQSPNSGFPGNPCREHYPQALMSRHRRNQAMLRISQRSGRNLPPGNSPSQSGTPILAPKPISPAKELRVRNSIPQLMKALPALPGDSSPATSSLELHREDLDHETRSDRLAPMIVSTVGSNNIGLKSSVDPKARTREAVESTEGESNESNVRLGLTSPLPRFSADKFWIPPSEFAFASKADGIGTTSSDIPTAFLRKGRKLRLRVFRDALNHSNSHDDGTVRRHPEAKCPTTILEISERYSDGNEVQDSFAHDATTHNETGRLDNGDGDETASLPTESPELYQADLEDGPRRGNSLDIHLERPLLSGTTIFATTTADTHNQPSVEQPEIISEKQRGPRKHFSKMKLRLTESLTRRSGHNLAEELRVADDTDPATRPGEPDEIQLLSPSRKEASFKDKLGSGRASQIARVHSKGKVRRRFSKLVKGARQTFRMYIHKGSQGGPTVV